MQNYQYSFPLEGNFKLEMSVYMKEGERIANNATVEKLQTKT